MLDSLIQGDILIFDSDELCGMMNLLFHKILSNEIVSAFHDRSYGTFCVYSKSPIISIVGLLTTEIIEPNKNPAKDFLAGFLAGNQINLSVSLNRSKQSLNLDLLGFRSQIAILYYLRVTVTQCL
ncbi:hypothetical protein KP742_10890 [Streptococcus equi subsp. zooepidemicus]|nr:hypothetical protein [Streptococcus equi subsp. zooepidemicus]HEL0601799.1 hypothetical protein [Streptococcus equi subsp. zooepidemicus]HEL0635689.1 hypothetical protein [Streptococcus equi subsp. zooepidemicus]HEL1223350.1 hypothetical protein [Streptococcus equi subsp. zooepidemicus]